MNNKISISKGNMKIGETPNISSTPGLTCRNNKYCMKRCYAMKAYRLYPNVRKAWNNNTRVLRGKDTSWINQVIDFCTREQPDFFRFHVAGDVETQRQLNNYFKIANSCPNTKFILFTKNFKLNYKEQPKNMKTIFSVWAGMENQVIPNGPVAYTGETKHVRNHSRVFECGGNCKTCGHLCWNIRNSEAVHFKIH